MKNKFYYILLGLLVSFSFINSVFAEEFTFTMTGIADNKEVVMGSQGTITVNLKSENVISSCQFNVEVDANLEFVSKSGVSTWTFGEDIGSLMTIKNNSINNVAKPEGENAFNLVYKVNGNGKVVIKDIVCKSSNNGEEVSGTSQNIEVDFTVKEAADDTTLSSLTVVGSTSSIEFSPDNYSYGFSLESSNFSLNMTTSNPDYQDKIVVTDTNGNTLDPKNIVFNGDAGQGLMRIVITINGNTSKQYELVASYEQKELDNSLVSLKIDGKEITLSEDKMDYTYTAGKNVTRVNIDAILKDSANFQFREGNEPGVYQLHDNGTTSIALMIVPKSSQSGASGKTYYIEIVKEGSSNNNNSNNNSGNNNGNGGNNNGNATTNPSTGNISIFVIAIILISSLVGSIFLYQKNLESYK